jgi:hypothetical protein
LITQSSAVVEILERTKNFGEKCKKTAAGFFFKMEGGHFVNANRLIQTLIDIDLKVYNAMQLVKRCPPTTNKKYPQLCTKRRSMQNPNSFTNNNALIIAMFKILL